MCFVNDVIRDSYFVYLFRKTDGIAIFVLKCRRFSFHPCSRAKQVKRLTSCYGSGCADSIVEGGEGCHYVGQCLVVLGRGLGGAEVEIANGGCAATILNNVYHRHDVGHIDCAVFVHVALGGVLLPLCANALVQLSSMTASSMRNFFVFIVSLLLNGL